MASARWASGISGSWYSPALWSPAAVPGGQAGSDDTATIDAAGTYTVAVGDSAAVTTIGSVVLNNVGATLAIAPSTKGLTVKTSVAVSSGTLLLNGVLSGGSLVLGAQGTVQGSFGGGLSGVRVLGTLALENNAGSSLTLANGVRFAAADGAAPGLVRLGSFSGLTVLGSSTLDNVQITDTGLQGAFLNVGNGAADQTVTLGSQSSLVVNRSLTLGGKGTFVNGGAITVGAAGGGAALLAIGSGVALTRLSIGRAITVLSNGTLAYGAAGSATTLGGLAGAVIQGGLVVNGNLTSAALSSGLSGAIVSGLVSLTGVVDNTASGAVLEVRSGTPLANVVLNGGVIQGGTMRLTSGTLGFGGTAVLDGVRVLGALNIASSNPAATPASVLALRNGPSFAGIGGAGRGSIRLAAGELRLLDGATLDHVSIASVQVFYDVNSVAPSLVTLTAGTTVILGTDAVFSAGGRTVVSGGGTLLNTGSIGVTSSLSFSADTKLTRSSSGILTVLAGGTLSLAWFGTVAPLSGIASALIDGTIVLNGSLTSAAYASAFGTVTGGGRASLSGVLDNTGGTLVLAGNSVGGRLDVAGTVRNGTLSAAAGAFTLANGGVLDSVTLRGPFTLAQASYQPGLLVTFQRGLTLTGAGGTGPGALTLTNQNLQASDTTTLNGGAVTLTGGSVLSAALGSRLTLGSGTTLAVAGQNTLANVTNQGAIRVAGDATLAVDDTFQNTGTVDLAYGAKLLLSGVVSTAALNGLIGTTSGAGAVTLVGSPMIDNTGTTLTLLATSRLNGLAAASATLRGGTVAAAGGMIGFTGSNTLSGVRWQGVFRPTVRAAYTFTNGTFVEGVGGARPLIDLATSGSSLQLTSAIDNTDIKLSSGALYAALGPVVLGVGATLSVVSGSANLLSGLNNAGTVTTVGGVAFNALTNSGSVTISKGDALATSLTNSGTITLTDGSLTVSSSANLGGVIRFTNPAGALVFSAPGPVGAILADLQAGNTIDMQGLTYSASLSVTLQGSTLQVNQGNVLVGRFVLQGGVSAYSADQFSLSADNIGGTLLRTSHQLYTPAFSGPGIVFDRAYYLANNPDVVAAGFDPLQHYLSTGWKEFRDPSAFFSTRYYLNQNPDIAAAGINPLTHYAASGWREGRDPGTAFSTNAYLAANPDVRAAGVNPLQHYLVNGRAEGRQAFAASPHMVGAQDPLVDRAFYLAEHADVAASGEDAAQHYHRIGWTLGYNPSALFDTTYYLKTNPDIAAAGIDPLQHYEASGFKEGRQPSLAFSDARYLAAYADVAAAKIDPLLHYVSFGRFEGRMAFITGPQGSTTPDPLVDRAYYYAQFATIVPSAADATASYGQTGWRLGLNPDAYFDTNYYLRLNPDIRAAGIDPLKHYEQSGWKEHRNPSAAFSTDKYLAAYSDVRAGGVDPLTSFVTTGLAQGRTAFTV